MKTFMLPVDLNANGELSYPNDRIKDALEIMEKPMMYIYDVNKIIIL